MINDEAVEGLEGSAYVGFSPEENDAAKEYCRNNMPQILGLERAPVDGYVCPFCGSGSGPHGTGMTTPDGIHHRCWSCGKSWDVFDMAQQLENDGLLSLEGCNIFDKVYHLAGLYDMTYEQRQKLYSENIPLPVVSTGVLYRVNKTASSVEEQPPITLPDYRLYYDNYKHAFWGPIGANALEYMRARGIGDDTLKRFNVGFAAPKYCCRLRIPTDNADESTADYPKYGDYIDTTNGLGAIVIPVSKDCYVLRNLNKNSDKRYAKVTAKGNPFKVINAKVLFIDVPAVFIVEGYVDMLSVEEAGFPAVAIGTTGAPRDLQKVITLAYENGRLTNKRLVICEDNDDAGITGLKRIKTFLNTLPGVQYCCCDPCEGITDADGNSLKDANDALINNRERFKQNLETALLVPVTVVPSESSEDIENPAANSKKAVVETIVDASTAADNAIDETKEPVGTKTTTPHHFVLPVTQALTKFLADDGSRYNPIPSGIDELDKLLGGGLRIGLIGVQGMSGYGKSTLALQIADHLAEAGLAVLYVSLEMATVDLIAKSLARLMFDEQIKTADYGFESKSKSSVEVLTKNANPAFWSDEDINNYNAALNRYQSFADNIFIVEGGMVSTPDAVHTVDRIELCMKDIQQQTGNFPIVIVDYVQKLKGATMAANAKTLTEKQIIDESIYALRQLATKYNVPIIGILSMNRASYNSGVSLASAKGSGDIEYSCDILIGLDKPKDEADYSLTPEQEAKNAKKGIPKLVEMKVVKNRYGVPNLSHTFDFYGKQCCYTDVCELQQNAFCNCDAVSLEQLFLQ